MKKENIGAENEKGNLGIEAFCNFIGGLSVDLIAVAAGYYGKWLFKRIKIFGFH